ncbi:hypothetical protein SAMN05444266_102168 [Chitinophaga jiangningensis]|uniref:Copper resistance protein D n=1 Tax=Chitinophaga jiangningensis TaxID=1419482 RepID=A0A1M6Y630_9BACT|nr:hypothetical protein [Chitinophaga jiangningensis]SHL13691.1 hypothetical protein SAMN05444266_102168 [Chitinophaga jiangningensis]
MSTSIYYAALVLHVVGITLMAGTSFIDFIVFRAFNKTYPEDLNQSEVLVKFLNRLQRFLGIGMGLILLSGITMMAKMHQVWGAQLWFRIKMILLLVVIFNGLGLRRVLGKQLNQLFATANPENSRWHRITTRFYLVQLVQLILFILIFILSIFKFN